MSMNENQNMFGCFPAVIVAFLLGFGAFFGISQSSGEMPLPEVSTEEAQAAAPAGGMESLTIVETVSIQVSASLPATVTLTVAGFHPDGCQFPVEVQQTRTDSTVSVKIYRIVPTDVMCTMQLNPYSDTITSRRHVRQRQLYAGCERHGTRARSLINE